MLERTRNAGLKTKLGKCSFRVRSAELFKYRVSFGEMRSAGDKMNAFAPYNDPKCAGELLRFIGLVGFFSEHVVNSEDRLARLYAILDGTGWNNTKPKRRKVKMSVWKERWVMNRSAHSRPYSNVWRILMLRVRHRTGLRKILCAMRASPVAHTASRDAPVPRFAAALPLFLLSAREAAWRAGQAVQGVGRRVRVLPHAAWWRESVRAGARRGRGRVRQRAGGVCVPLGLGLPGDWGLLRGGLDRRARDLEREELSEGLECIE